MSLSLKAELELWVAALKAYDEQDFGSALDLFSRIADSSKILTNLGLIYATIGEHETAIEHFIAATNLDPYLAIAHFQCGVSNFLLQRYDLALLNFEDAYLYLRGNEAINYEQIGLKFKLFSAEVMFNKGLTQINLGYVEGGMRDMQEASRHKITNEHDVIDEAILDRGEGYTVFSIPVGVVYRPSENKIKNSKSKDYLGKAKLVAASDVSDAFTEFTGVKKLQQTSGEGLDIKEDKNQSNVGSPALSRNATTPASRADPVTARPTNLERSKTALPLGAWMRPNVATVSASRRSQSVSNPVNVPPPPHHALDLPSGTSTLGGSDTTRSEKNPTTSKTPHSTAGGTVVVGASVSKAGRETGATTDGAPTTPMNRPSLRKPKGQGTSQVMQQSAPQEIRQSLQPDQYVNATQSVSRLMLPAVPSPARGGHLTQFYDIYMDAYTDNPARPPTTQMKSSTSSLQRESPVELSFCQQSQDQQQHPAPSVIRTSSKTSSSSGRSGASSIPASVSTRNTSPNISRGRISNASGGIPRRKQPRHLATRKVTTYDEEGDDDESVMGRNDEFELAKIRVKLHYLGDVRGMAVPPTISFNEFVELVTTKFGTSLTGLAMKFADEDGTKISLRDKSDFELAIETARESARGWSEGKIEVWCVDV